MKLSQKLKEQKLTFISILMKLIIVQYDMHLIVTIKEHMLNILNISTKGLYG